MLGAFATGALALPASDVRGAKLACPRGTAEREAGTDAHETWCQRADGVRHGPFKRVWQYTHAEGQYRNGKRHGRWVQASVDTVARGSYVDDLEEGVWKFFYQGRKSAEGSYRHGERDGNATFLFEGRITDRGVYRNGVKHGAWAFFDEPPGSTVLECHGNKPHGMMIQRDDNGRLVRKGAYVGGIMVGWWMERLGNLVRARPLRGRQARRRGSHRHRGRAFSRPARGPSRPSPLPAGLRERLPRDAALIGSLSRSSICRSAKS